MRLGEFKLKKKKIRLDKFESNVFSSSKSKQQKSDKFRKIDMLQLF